MIQIKDTTAISNALNSLDAAKQPVWGSMTPQQMIEHLALSVKGSYRSKLTEITVPEEKSKTMKQFFIFSDAELPRNVKSSMYADGNLPPLKHANIAEATNALVEEIKHFYAHFSSSEGVTTMNPFLGPLTQEEWEIFHGKHFLHHFKQFELP